jgi:hypothetical protein
MMFDDMPKGRSRQTKAGSLVPRTRSNPGSDLER